MGDGLDRKSPEGLLVATSAGDSVAVDLRHPGGGSRFAFGSPGHRSSIWKLVVTTSGEIYLMEREVGRDLKFSLHRSGDWRFAWVDNGGALTPSGEDWAAKFGSRILDRWSRPEPTLGHYTVAVSIRVGAGELRPTEDSESIHDEVDFCTPPEPGRVGVFTVMLCTPDPKGFVVDDSAVVAAFSTETPFTVIAMASHTDPEPGEAGIVDSLRESVRQLQRERHGREPADLANRRGFFQRPFGDGRRVVWELALD